MQNIIISDSTAASFTIVNVFFALSGTLDLNIQIYHFLILNDLFNFLKCCISFFDVVIVFFSF